MKVSFYVTNDEIGDLLARSLLLNIFDEADGYEDGSPSERPAREIIVHARMHIEKKHLRGMISGASVGLQVSLWGEYGFDIVRQRLCPARAPVDNAVR